MQIFCIGYYHSSVAENNEGFNENLMSLLQSQNPLYFQRIIIVNEES